MVNDATSPKDNIADYNAAVLKQVAREKIGVRVGTNREIAKLTKLVHLAAANVLSDITPYLSGAKKISKKQIQKIKDKFEDLKTKMGRSIARREADLAKKAHLLMAMVSNLRDRAINPARPMSFDQVLEDYYQITGCITAYGKWKKGDEILGPHPNLPNYEVDEVIKNRKGLQIIVLKPKGQPPEGYSMPPIVCCRGTVPTNPHNIIDDMNRHIGQYSFQDSKDQITAALKRVTEEGETPAVVTGHSLGGALAQLITAECCDQTNALGQPLIQSAYHYNAPGVGDEVAAGYDRKVAQLPEERKPKVVSYHHASDIINLAGGAHLRPDARHEVGTLVISKQQVRAAHSFPKLISEIGSKIATPIFSKKRRILSYIAEKLRQTVSKILRCIFIIRVKTAEKHRSTAEIIGKFVKLSPQQQTKLTQKELQNLQVNRS